MQATAPTKKPSASQQAQAFANLCREYGWQYEASRPNVLTITKRIPSGDKEAFTTADMEYGSLFAFAPLKGGSVWGTDGGGIGGMAALASGVFTMKKSGSGKRFMAELDKLKS